MTTQLDTPITPDQSERRRIGGLIIGSALLAAVGVGALAYTATNAAFTGVTDGAVGNFGAATVSITEDDFGGVPFTAADMLPGESVSSCILVTYTGSGVPSQPTSGLRLYATPAPAGDLADNLQLTITHRGASTTCASAAAANPVYSSDFELFPTGYGTGASGFLPTAAGQSVAYDFTVTLEAATLDEAQGDTATATFFWEVRSN